jgi:hypothetical protein
LHGTWTVSGADGDPARVEKSRSRRRHEWGVCSCTPCLGIKGEIEAESSRGLHGRFKQVKLVRVSMQVAGGDSEVREGGKRSMGVVAACQWLPVGGAGSLSIQAHCNI